VDCRRSGIRDDSELETSARTGSTGEAMAIQLTPAAHKICGQQFRRVHRRQRDSLRSQSREHKADAGFEHLFTSLPDSVPMNPLCRPRVSPPGLQSRLAGRRSKRVFGFQIPIETGVNYHQGQNKSPETRPFRQPQVPLSAQLANLRLDISPRGNSDRESCS